MVAPFPVGCVVAGAQKGGTTALATFLLEHPEIALSHVKEPHFFDNEENFAAPAPDYTGYHAMFAPRPEARVLSDCTPIYMYWNAAPQRIARYNPAMKWIMLLRDPAARAYSHWNMEVLRQRESLSFDEAIRMEDERCRESFPLQLRLCSYVDRGRYARQVRHILEHFPAEQLLVLRSEAFQADPAPDLARVAAFLGIGPFPRTSRRKVFALPYAAPMGASARQFLHAALEPDIRELERMLGWDCGEWLK